MTKKSLNERTMQLQKEVTLEAAAKLFSELGPKAVTMRKIASDSKSSTSVIYRLFKNKQGVIEALFIEAYLRFQRKVELLPKSDDKLEFLLQICGLLWDYAEEYPHYYRIIHGAPFPGFLPVYMKAKEPGVKPRDRVREAITILINQGQYPGMKDTHVMIAMYSMAVGLINAHINKLFPEVEFSRKMFIDTLDKTLRGISLACGADH